jgi:hypothetical protein
MRFGVTPFNSHGYKSYNTTSFGRCFEKPRYVTSIPALVSEVLSVVYIRGSEVPLFRFLHINFAKSLKLHGLAKFHSSARVVMN